MGPVSQSVTKESVTMRSIFTIILLLTLTLGDTEPSEPSETSEHLPCHECPEENVAFDCEPTFLIIEHDLTDWHACGSLCEEIPKCTFWTFDDLNRCWLKNCDGGQRHKANLVSGGKGCK